MDDAADGRLPSKTRLSSLPVVAIGASAGGLEALKEMLAEVRADSGAAYVVVQHLDPTHKSMLTDLLGRATELPVRVAEDRAPLEPDTVYVIPEDATLRIRDGHLDVQHPAPPRARRTPIDALISSLAGELGECGIAVILSGTGSDGTQGVRELKEAGGFVAVQAPDDAAYDSMPRNAIATGLTDKTVPAREIPSVIAEYVAHLRDGGADAIFDRADMRQVLARICQHLKLSTGHDFREYKEPTLLRRVRRRMQVLHIDDIEEYAERLKDDRAEARQLFRELLISVTSFFRDPDAYEALDNAVDKMLAGKARGDAIRVWVPGCATGEEAYSIAMLLLDKLEIGDQKFPIQIFATDIDENALAIARRGIYPESIAAYLPERLLKRYFRIRGNEFQIAEEVRELCIFSTQSLVKDPPFSRLDLLSCRNLLIYLKPDLQNRLVPIFHYALRPGAILLLGPSESITGHEQLFEPLDKKWRLFTRRQTEPASEPRFPLMSLTGDFGSRDQPGRSTPKRERDGMVAMVHKLVLEEMGPGFVIVGPNRELLYSGGRIEPFLRMPLGMPLLELINVVVPDLKMDLRALWHRVTSDQAEVCRENIALPEGTGRRRVRITARPLREDANGNLNYLFLFEDLGPVLQDDGVKPEPADASNIEALEAELRSTKEYLQTTTEELESSNEELKSANEELMSMNEELQSSNEELETSKEELQSINEELETVNSELSNKVEELAEANADLENFLKSTDIATLFLDRSSRIRRFTPKAQELFHLLQGDTGRPIADITSRIDSVDFNAEVARVLRDLREVERDVQLAGGSQTFTMRLMPYRSKSDTIDGVVVTFTDVTRLKGAQDKIRDLNALLLAQVDDLEALLDLAPIGIAFADDAQCSRIELNHFAQNLFQLGETTAPPGWPNDGYRIFSDGKEVPAEDLPMQKAWRTGQPVYDFRGRFIGDNGHEFEMLKSAVPLLTPEGEVRRVICVISDVTEMIEHQREAELRERRSSYIAEIGRQSLAGASADDLIRAAPQRLADLLSADYAKVLMRAPNDDNLVLRSSVGFEVPLGTIVPGGNNSQAGYTLQTRQPVVVFDLPSETRFNGPALLRDAGVKSGISVLIGDVTEPMGVLGIHSRRIRSFSDEEIHLTQTVANLLADALRREASDRQKMILLDELRHRVKNMLATVQSVTSLSLRKAGVDRKASAAILERLQALALAHDLNFRRNDSNVDLKELIELQCAPYDASRITITGDSKAELQPSIAIDTSVIIHELITNAVKHGALSTPEGAIEIRLEAVSGPEAQAHVIEWVETGRRPGAGEAEPGTGTRLIEAIASQAAFDIKRQLRDDGFTCRIVISL
jgi:two-component system CheB/CheR fusion protein